MNTIKLNADSGEDGQDEPNIDKALNEAKNSSTITGLAHKPMSAETEDIYTALDRVREKIAQFGKKVRLVAVSKSIATTGILQAYKAGQRHFGENYVQELYEKYFQLPTDIKWHFIGHLQSNKVKKLLEVPSLWVVETIDREKIAHELHDQIELNKKNPFNTNLVSHPLRVFIQIKTSDEDAKTGLKPSECVNLAKTIIQKYTNLKLCGIMGIAKYDVDPSEEYKMLARCRSEIEEELCIEGTLELSMGMSRDYELAIELGSTNVRVGTSIFGSRPKKN